MLLTPHLLAGAAVAAKISNPLFAFPVALLSHYFLDSLPQEEYSIENIQQRRWKQSWRDFFKVFADILLGLLLILLFSDRNQTIFAGAFLAIVPDGITLLSKIIYPNQIFSWHQKIHMALNGICDSKKNKKIPVFLGIFTQVAVTLIAIFLLR